MEEGCGCFPWALPIMPQITWAENRAKPGLPAAIRTTATGKAPILCPDEKYSGVHVPDMLSLFRRQLPLPGWAMVEPQLQRSALKDASSLSAALSWTP